MNSILNLVIMILLVFSAAEMAPAGNFDPKNTIIIRGEISNESLAPVSLRLAQLIQKEVPPDVVNFIIDSPGGSVHAGFRFISQMKALQGKGTKINCYVPGLAASMAFHILTHCNARNVLQESALLWHRARVLIFLAAVTAPAASALARDLEQVDEHILADVMSQLSKEIGKAAVLYHFDNETLHIGKTLCRSAPNFCTERMYIPGLMEALSNKSIPASDTKVRSEFTEEESYIYIHPDYFKDRSIFP